MKQQTWRLCMVGVLSAAAFLFMLLELPLPFLPPFLKLDFSEIPALLAAFALGPLEGVAVCLVKNLLHLFVSQTSGVGELSNFLLGVCFVLPAGMIYRFKKTKAGAFFSSLIGCMSMAVLSLPLNYFLIYPIYYRLLAPESVILDLCRTILPSIESIFTSLLVFNLPLTFGKGLIDVTAVILVYKKLSPILKGIRH